MSRSSGSCYGFAIRSELAFRYLRDGGGGGETLEVDECTLDHPEPSFQLL